MPSGTLSAPAVRHPKLKERKEIVTLRLTPEMHQQLKRAAHHKYTSLNQLLVQVCQEYLDKEPTPA